MKNRRSAIFVWLLFIIIVVADMLYTAGLVRQLPAGYDIFDLLEILLWGFLAAEFAFVASLIVSQRPGNPIGLLMMLLPITFLADIFAENYLNQFPVAPPELTLSLFVSLMIDSLGWLLLIFPLLFIMLLFPNGRPPSPRWRWIIVVGLGMCVFITLFALALPTISMVENSTWGSVPNPIGFLPEGTEFPETFWFAGLIIMTLSCAAAPFVRYRHTSGGERQQIKWLFYGCGLFALVYTSGFVFTETEDTLANHIWGVFFLLSMMGIPAVIAIAILRYQLYDINIIIRKTVLYGVLTGLLIAIYFGAVVSLQTLFESISGQKSPIAIVISTLLIAAIFSSLRRRLQSIIDRRFFRQKYDAQLVLTQFAQTAREEVALQSLADELARVTQETVQPQSISIWLKR